MYRLQAYMCFKTIHLCPHRSIHPSSVWQIEFKWEVSTPLHCDSNYTNSYCHSNDLRHSLYCKLDRDLTAAYAKRLAEPTHTYPHTRPAGSGKAWSWAEACVLALDQSGWHSGALLGDWKFTDSFMLITLSGGFNSLFILPFCVLLVTQVSKLTRDFYWSFPSQVSPNQIRS